MKISILTLFPEMFQGPFDHSIIKHAKDKGLVTIDFVNIRDFGIGTHKSVDDTAYGGGIGMVMRVDVIHEAIKQTKQKFTQQYSNITMKQWVVLLTASGKPFKQPTAKQYAKVDHLILICGHYEGIDDRIRHFIDEEISLGDFVTTAGEIPAMLITDSVVRLLPEVLKVGATENESFSLTNTANNESYIEYPQYTKPQTYETFVVPEILMGGNHQKIAEWRLEQAKKRTKDIRPDLLK